ERTVVLMRRGESLIELALDEGWVIAGERKAPILEVELELRQGNLAELFNLAQELAQEVPVWLSDISKAERGYRLGSALISQSEPKALLPAEQWLRKIYRRWLRQIEAFRAQPSQTAALALIEVVATLQSAVAELADWSWDLAKREALARELAEELRLLEGVVENITSAPQEALAQFEGSRRAGQIALAFSRWFAVA